MADNKEDTKKKPDDISFFDISVLSSIIMGFLTDIVVLILIITIVGIPLAVILRLAMGAMAFGSLYSKLKRLSSKFFLGSAILSFMPLGQAVISAVALDNKATRKLIEIGATAAGGGTVVKAVNAVDKAAEVASEAKNDAKATTGAEKTRATSEETIGKGELSQSTEKEGGKTIPERPGGAETFEEMEKAQGPQFEKMISTQEEPTAPSGTTLARKAPSEPEVEAPQVSEAQSRVREVFKPYEEIISTGQSEEGITKPAQSANPQEPIEKQSGKKDNKEEKKPAGIGYDVQKESVDIKS